MSTPKRLKEKIAIIRKFLSGEDVAEYFQSIEPIEPAWVFRFRNANSPSWQDDRILIDGKLVTEREYEQIIAQKRATGSFIWDETKTYNSQTEL